jgi:DNA-binding CsgD family transcriptional regulator
VKSPKTPFSSAPLDHNAPSSVVSPGRLINAILGRPEPIVIIEGAAGMGKSTLLRILEADSGARIHAGSRPPDPPGRGTIALWDIAPDRPALPLTDLHLRCEGRLVIAKRPEQRLCGLDRGIAYGCVAILGEDALCFREEDLLVPLGASAARRMIAATGGWPALVAAQLADREPEAAAYCFREMYAGLPDDALVRAEQILTTDASAALPPPGPFRELARRQARAEIARRSSEPEGSRRLALAFERAGAAPRAVATLQQAGLEDEALAAFVNAGGWAFIFHYGPEAFDAALAGFSDALRRHSEALIIALAFQAIKRGDVPRATRLIAERVGPTSRDRARMFAENSTLSTPMRAFCFLMMLYEGLTPDDDLFEQGFATLAQIPTGADLERGSFYNAALEFRIRENRFAEADDLAQRALLHYERAGVAILSFYVCIHMTVIRLNTGDLEVARRHCESARAWLARVPYESPGDARIFALVEACVRYEAGDAEALMNFLADEAEQLTLGETWPSLVELAVQYGAQALGEHYSTRAALAFVERWRLHGVKSQTIKLAIELRRVVVLQSANRWDDAEEALTALTPRISRERILAGTVDLARLRDRESLLCALVWMRQIAFRWPKTPGLERRLAALRDNFALAPRQRVGLEIWLAYVWRMNRDLGRARTAFRGALEDAAESGALAPLAAERVFLSELAAQKQIVAFAESSPQGRQTLRKLNDLGFAPSPASAKLGLTRQEAKLLMLACRGATNKDAAKALGLSQSTVKFHLGNAYRKLGCRRRSEAAAAAHAFGLMR